MTIDFLLGFLLTGMGVLIFMLLIEFGKWVLALWESNRAGSGRHRASDSFSRQSGQVALPGAKRRSKNTTKPAKFRTPETEEGRSGQRTSHHNPYIDENAFIIPDEPKFPSPPLIRMHEEQFTRPAPQRSSLEVFPAKPLCPKKEAGNRAQPIKPVVRIVQFSDTAKKRADLPPHSEAPEPKPAPTAQPPSRLWLRAFFTQFAEKARKENCCIDSQIKMESPNAIWLEIQEPLLTHTSWNLDENGVALVFYCSEPAKAAIQMLDNDRRFRQLLKHKTEIEQAYCWPLEWDFVDGRNYQKVVARGETQATANARPLWGYIQDDRIFRMKQLSAVLKPYLAELDYRPAMQRLDARPAEQKSDVPARPKSVVSPTRSEKCTTVSPGTRNAAGVRPQRTEDPIFQGIPIMAKTWREEFFTQLAEKARLEKCFIYNPDKEIVAGTIRLEIREPLLTHTAWNLDEGQASLAFYSANPTKAATDVPENNRRFKSLKKHKAAIEKAFGEPLDWDFDADRKHQKVVTHAKKKAAEDNRKDWTKIQADLIGRMKRLGSALKPYLAKLEEPSSEKPLNVRQTELKSDVPVRTKQVVSPATKPAGKTVQRPRPAPAKQPEFDPDDLTI